MKLQNLVKVLILVVVCSLVISMGIGCKETPEEDVGETSTEDTSEQTAEEPEDSIEEESEKEPVELIFWWWGEQEAPGLEGWMDETVSMYEELNPHISVETVLQSTETLITAFKSAAAAQQGPDLQYFWGGVYTIEDAWEGNIVPISDYISEDELAHYFTSSEQVFDGKTWGAVWYLQINPVVYNKTIFEEVGLDPENPFETWDEFMEACKTIKEAGYIPLSLGGKEGFGGEWLSCYLGVQNSSSIADIMAPVAGDAKFTDPKYAEWWSKLGELRDNGYINDDYNSTEFYQGQDMFANGESAMTFTISAGAIDFAKTMGEDVVGIMAAPKWGSGDFAGKLTVSSQTVGITSWSENKEEAADFIKFMHSPERVNAMYDQSGAYPADDRFDSSLLKTVQETQISDLITGDNPPWRVNHLPTQLTEEAYYAGVQEFFNGLSPEDMAVKSQEIIEKWRTQQPDAFDNFTKWYESLK